MEAELISKYLRNDFLPHIWCPGCGNGILLKDIARALDRLNIDKNKVCIISGIGCAARAAGYLDCNTMHTTHGRAIAMATGVKMANPELKVIVITGDGDAVAIGGNHFIHAARRNIDLTVLVFNNYTYGMTGGQVSPTTPMAEYATTAPYGSIDQNFNITFLAVAAGSTFVARGTAYHVDITTTLIERGIKHKGFSVIECVSPCPSCYGHRNQKGSAVKMMNYLRNNVITREDFRNHSKEEIKKRLLIGEIYHHNRPEYSRQYQQIVARLQQEGKQGND